MRTSTFLISVISLAVLSFASAESPPLDPGLTEDVESRLVQFELRVSRNGAPIAGLKAQDIDIELGGKPLRSFTVDDICGGPSASVAAPVPTRRGSSIFYFDEPELTMEGRHRAVEVARLVATALISRGHDVYVLRNAEMVRAETTWTHDPVEVSAALDRIASDPGNRDYLRPAADELQAERLIERARDVVRESEQARQVADRAAESNFACGQNKWRASESAAEAAAGDATLGGLVGELGTLVQDELRRTDRDIQRLRGALGLLALREAPKGIVYFGDTLRRDPGGGVADELDELTRSTPRAQQAQWRARLSSRTADGALEALVRDASMYGARFYAVEGRGLTTASDWVRASQDTLASLALDTGGLSFLNGLKGSVIAERVVADQSCWYLVSFKPSGWEQDRALGLAVWPRERGVRVQTRSSLVIPSRKTLTEARLMAAHFGDQNTDEQPLALAIYPVGGTAKRMDVMAQIRFPANQVPNTRESIWDIGFQVLSQGAVVSHTSNRVTWHGSGAPPIYQTTLSLPTGPYDIVAVARDIATDSIREGRFHGTWPAVIADPVALSLPSLAQPLRSGVVVDGQVNPHGVVVRGAGDAVDPGEPIGIVTAACIAGPTDVPVRAERSIEGVTEVSFAPMTLSKDRGRCVQIRDMVPAGSLGAGRLKYRLRLYSGDNPIASQELPFEVAEPSSAARQPTIAASAELTQD